MSKLSKLYFFQSQWKCQCNKDTNIILENSKKKDWQGTSLNRYENILLSCGNLPFGRAVWIDKVHFWKSCVDILANVQFATLV